jgi:methylenetetrahydrofolate dehydrogenase (NADP+) / methenyltetrahydrofolate cyclohydrolase
MTTIIDGKKIARQVRERVAASVAATFPGPGSAPGLATILVGEDPASAVYVAGKRRAVREAGMVDQHRSLPAESSQSRRNCTRRAAPPRWPPFRASASISV